MTLDILIGLATLIIALNGLIYQPKKDPRAPVAWNNINTYGRIFIAVLIFIVSLNVAKTAFDRRHRSAEIRKRDSEIGKLIHSQSKLEQLNQQLLSSQHALEKKNQHLIKVMSVADGYSAVIRGVVSFRSAVTERQIRKALNNLFLKFARIELSAKNVFGKYEGKIDHAANPEVRRFLGLSNIGQDSPFYHYRNLGLANGYFFEVRCSKIKILNQEKIQYARFGPEDEFNIRVETFEWSQDFNRIYKVGRVFLDQIEIEELERFQVRKMLTF